jgi:2-polyprenyl-6-hydroxyphenyl methylase/3-demethylubiquinone-9 3-methyltransferase
MGVNNSIYSELGARWYDAKDDPVALLRAESKLRNPWVAREIETRLGAHASVLDVGCGGGFLSNALAARGHRVVGIDESAHALAIAAAHDSSRSVTYKAADALALPFDDAAFDVVCAMDFLEHVEDPKRAVAEASRVLAPGGLYFFHTFNRNFLSWLVVIKGVEWFVKNTPRNMHVLPLFLKPHEVASMCNAQGLDVIEMRGVRPKIGKSFWSMLSTGAVDDRFEFIFTTSLLLGFSGLARKRT